MKKTIVGLSLFVLVGLTLFASLSGSPSQPALSTPPPDFADTSDPRQMPPDPAESAVPLLVAQAAVPTQAPPPPSSTSQETSSAAPADASTAGPPPAAPVLPEIKISNGQSGMTLDQALAIAYKQSPQILEAEDAIKQASGYIVETRAAAMPHLVLTTDMAQADKNRTANLSASPNPFEIPATQDPEQAAGSQWSVQIKLVKTIFDAGTNRYLIGSAKVSEAMARYAMEDVVQQVDLQVRQAFYQVLLQQEKLQVYEDAIGALGKVSDKIQNQQQFGTSNNFNVLRSQIGADNFEPLCQQAAMGYIDSERQLAILLGMDQNQAQDVLYGPGVSGKLPMKVSTFDSDVALREAENERPLIKKLEMAAEAERLGMKAEAANYYPKVDLFGDVGMSSLAINEHGRDTTENAGYIIGVSGTWAFMDGGLAKGKTMQAKAAYGSALHALMGAKAASTINVTEELRALASYQREVDSYPAVLNRLKQCDDLSSDRAFNGNGSVFELAQTLQVTTATRAQVWQEVYNLNAAYALLEYLTGKSVSVNGQN